MRCPKCNEENLPNSSFCSNCGASLVPEPQSSDAEDIHVAETIIGSPVLFCLTLLTGPEKDKTFTLEKNEIRLGRETDNDVILVDPQVSRHHAKIVRKGGNYEIEDLGSANGVSLNNVRIALPQSLKEGDKFKLGNTEVLFSKLPVVSEPIEIDEPTISMQDETPVKPQPVLKTETENQVTPPPPPPPAPPSAGGSDALDSPTSPRPQPVPVMPQREKAGAGKWILLSCALIILLLLILAGLILIVMPQLGQQFR